MASATNEITTQSTAAAVSYSSGAFTPAAADLLVVFAAVSATVDTGTCADSIGARTYTQIARAASGSGAHMLYAYVADQLIGSPVSMTVTVGVASDAGTGAVVGVVAVAGMAKTGAAAIRQSAKDENRTTGVPMTAALAASCLTGNVTLGAVGEELGPAANSAVEPSGTTELGDLGFATPSHSLEYWGRDSGYTGTTPAWTSVVSAICSAIVVELDTTAPVYQIRTAIPFTQGAGGGAFGGAGPH